MHSLFTSEEPGYDRKHPLDDLQNHKPAKNNIDALLQQHILDENELKESIIGGNEVIIMKNKKDEDSSDED